LIKNRSELYTSACAF